MTTDKIKGLIEMLKKREGEIIHALVEDDSIYVPEVLLRLVWELRSIRRIINYLEK